MMSDQYNFTSDTKEKSVYVKVLGCLTMEYNGKVLNYESFHSQQLIRLFAYMVISHGQSISATNLCEILWPEEGSDNPLGALKNLVYRLRKVLRKAFGDISFIASGPGYYGWNQEVPIRLDMEEFEMQCKRHNYLEALLLYQGELLKNVVTDYWAISYATYYHSFYLSAVKHLATEMGEHQQYSVVERICMRALGVDVLDEEMHCLAIKAMCKQGKWKRAQDYHRRVLDIYQTELGITRLPELEHCYKQYYEDEIRSML